MSGLRSSFHGVAPLGGASGRQPLHRSPSHKTTRDCPRVTVRFSPDDYARVKALANGMALSVYLRAKALDDELPRRRRTGVSDLDLAALAQVLGLLGQSRIANNLNQLAHKANLGSLVMDDVAYAQIEEAYARVREMRALLMQALGKKTQSVSVAS